LSTRKKGKTVKKSFIHILGLKKGEKYGKIFANFSVGWLSAYTFGGCVQGYLPDSIVFGVS